jgi:hypothetical protein
MCRSERGTMAATAAIRTSVDPIRPLSSRRFTDRSLRVASLGHLQKRIVCNPWEC